MAKRNTRTGGVLEAMVLPALDQGGYERAVQVHIGQRLGCAKHFVAKRDDEKILVSMKWQQVSGTAEQKVPFEVICLLEALESEDYTKAYLVLGGEGWTLRKFHIGEGLKKFLKKFIDYDGKVEIMTLEAFVARANAGRL